MPFETILAALGGLALGGGAVMIHARRRERQRSRERLELEMRLRRVVVPVLERRADVLGIPPADRGQNADGPVGLTLTLARAIKEEEESGELPFGDTVEVSRDQLEAEVSASGTEKKGRA